MAREEVRHWWYRGLRHVLKKSIASLEPPLRGQPRVLDAGCGTGENLRFLSELLHPSYLGGFDSSEAALGFARCKVPHADLYRSDICRPDVRASELDLIVSTDVLYMVGLDRALEGMHDLVRQLGPGGALMLNVPALSRLWSEHDVAVHTKQRFTVTELSQYVADLGLRVEVATYRLFLLFPAMLVSRLPSMWRARFRPDPHARSDLQDTPWAVTNRLLTSIMQLEGSMIGAGVKFPIGGSAYVIGRKAPS